MTTVNDWESLIVGTKISILVTLGVLNSPLMSKLTETRIITKQIFFLDLFNNDTVVSDFQNYCCSNLEKENTLTNEIRKHFKGPATERCSSNLCLTVTIQII